MCTCSLADRSPVGAATKWDGRQPSRRTALAPPPAFCGSSPILSGCSSLSRQLRPAPPSSSRCSSCCWLHVPFLVLVPARFSLLCFVGKLFFFRSNFETEVGQPNRDLIEIELLAVLGRKFLGIPTFVLVWYNVHQCSTAVVGTTSFLSSAVLQWLVSGAWLLLNARRTCRKKSQRCSAG